MTKKEYNRHFDEIIQAFNGGFINDIKARTEIYNLGAHFVHEEMKQGKTEQMRKFAKDNEIEVIEVKVTKGVKKEDEYCECGDKIGHISSCHIEEKKQHFVTCPICQTAYEGDECPMSHGELK